MRTLLEAVIDGLEFNADFQTAPDAVDFALTQAGTTLVMLGNWWEVDWGPGEGLQFFRHELTPELPPDGADPVRWYFPTLKGVSLDPPADGTAEKRLARVRTRQDIFRRKYLDSLVQLQRSLGDDMDLREWQDQVAQRPLLDPAAELRKQNFGVRQVGSIRLLAAGDTLMDVLVVDEFGNAATANKTPWLEAMGDMWVEMDPRPAMEDWLTWLAEERPSGVVASVTDPRVMRVEGEIDAIALRLIA